MATVTVVRKEPTPPPIESIVLTLSEIEAGRICRWIEAYAEYICVPTRESLRMYRDLTFTLGLPVAEPLRTFIESL